MLVTSSVSSESEASDLCAPFISFFFVCWDPEQILRLLPSTAGLATWTVIPPGCSTNETGTSGSETCAQSRGCPFNISQSTSWQYLGNNSLGLEHDLGGDGLSATFGTNTIALGFTNATGGPTLHSQLVTGLEADFLLQRSLRPWKPAN